MGPRRLFAESMFLPTVIAYTNDAQILGTGSLRYLLFCNGVLTFVGIQYATCFIAPFLCLEFCGGSWIFGKFVHS